MNIYSWIENNAKGMPDKVCMKNNQEEITFLELSKMTRAMGNALRKAGISRGDHVALILPNIPEFVITYMAVAGIGAVVIPVNPSFTPREIAHILKDSDSKAMVMEHGHINKYNRIQDTCPLDTVITTGEGGNFSQWVTGSHEFMKEEMDPDEVVAMIYSTGLTGHHFGSMLTHKNLDHNSDLMRSCMNCDHTDTTLALIPCFHSFGATVNMLSMLRYGGTVYLMKKLDFKELHHALTEGGVTAFGAVPTLFHALVYHPDLQDIRYTHMEALIAGGSALSIDIYRDFKERFHTDIRQGYGITEASPVCTVNNVHVKIKPESIGPTVPDVEVKVVDESGSILGPGEKGGLLFKGPNIMKGYYKREKETREIIKHGWLYTGDLGYVDEDGFVYITGHKKEMVITSGFNVYCNEVEGILANIPGVRASAITGVPDPFRGTVIKAYIVRDNANLSEEDVKRYARKELAPYKTPRQVEFVEKIPRMKSRNE